jgi:FtsP/CotA-like multicopper oxidase with cupredoxin domain
MNPGGTPDYFGTVPNYANSPLPTVVGGVVTPSTGIRKFVDTLPLLGPAGINDLNQYIPVAVADTTTYPGSDYYEIAIVQYTQKLSLDLPATTLRGYVQISTSVVPGKHIALTYPNGSAILDNKGNPVFAVDNPQYLGPMIVAHSYNSAYAAGATMPGGLVNGQPTRVKYDNYLPIGTDGNLFIPMDSTTMGAGTGPTGEVTGIRILTRGAGYTSVPTVTISGGTPTTNATAVATILNGVVNTLHITNPGTAYSSAPAVTISGGGATTNATASLTWVGATAASYTQNRSNIHLHGGVTPWISDGTPDQWITPATETSSYPEGVSVENVPDMPDPGPGSMTLFYTNEQSARLMFYHDHSYGITRLNVYTGAAAGYLLQDPVEQGLVANGTLPPTANEIPLIIQDKTFVPSAAQLGTEDPTWNAGSKPGTVVTGDLWFPHVYMPNQNPFDIQGVNAVGRWDYGPWFWPPYTGLVNGPVANPIANSTPMEGPVNPGTPNPSMVPEGFMDTPLVNGTAYPTLNVNPTSYRFQILNAANDRTFNLQMYQTSSIIGTITLATPGSGYTNIPAVTITNGAGDTTGEGATAVASVDLDPSSLTYGQVNGLILWTVGSGYTAVPTVKIAPPLIGTAATATATLYTGQTEVGMVPFNNSQNAVTPFPATWYVAGNPYTLDDRNGGVPDPTKRGPAMVQIGTEGGLLPNPVVIDSQPVNYVYNRRDITVLNVAQKALMLGPAERADVVVDFSQFAGKTLILYNDSPAPMPAADPRNDYFTGDPDQTSSGGAPTTMPGYGPNTRTIMKIVVSGSGGTAPADAVPANLAAIKAALPTAFAASQPQKIVPPGVYARIQDYNLTFTPVGQTTPITFPMQPKTIQELFEVNYGRMNATLGVEIPNSNINTQTTIPLGYIDPTTELLGATTLATPISLTDGTQIWRITHNGVDTHAIHFHLFNVQVINRVGWDGAIRPPDPNELGWKDTVRMSPLEDVIVALRPILPIVPFAVPNSIRAMDVTSPIGSTMGFFGVDPNGNPSAVVNQLVNYGWEYVWHCHLLGHEENDMMRPMALVVAPAAPTLLAAYQVSSPLPGVKLIWMNNASNATTFIIQRATILDPTFLNPVNIDSGGLVTTFTDTNASPGMNYYYRVIASNVVGGGAGAPGYPSMTANSTPSNFLLLSGYQFYMPLINR